MRTVTVTQGLEGTGLVTNVPYQAVEVELTSINHLPPPGTGTFRNLIATLLVPDGNASAMLLVVVLKGTVASDETVFSEMEQVYLVCAPSSR